MDPSGKKISVRDYVNGALFEYHWEEVNGQWNFYDDNMFVYSGDNDYIIALAQNLSFLMQGETGLAMVKEVAGYNENILIEDTFYLTQKEGKENYHNFYKNKSIGWSSTTSRIGSTFLSLAHEMAHAMDDLRGTMNNDIWIPKFSYLGLDEDISYSELFATHIENKIRKEQGIGLREAYLLGDNFIFSALSKIIDPYGNSLYFDQKESTSYKYVFPSQRYKY